MSLRMNSGLEKSVFEQRFAKPVEAVFGAALQRCIGRGWMEESDTAYRLTEEGRVLGNLVFLEFIE